MATPSDGLASPDVKPYEILDGKVDPGTYNGFRRYHAGCNHYHGPDAIGSSFGPTLIARPLNYADFAKVVLEGRAAGTSVMKGYANDPNVAPYLRDLYGYISARADGALGRGRPQRYDSD